MRKLRGAGDGRMTLRLTVMFALLAIANIGLWAAAIVTFRHYPLLLGTAFLAYSFGLRHALDADHIAAIDNVTRKLMQQGQRPIGVGLSFSLGHSTIVIGLSAAIALTTAALKSSFARLETFGDAAGTLISAFFLLAIAAANLLVLIAIFRAFQRFKAGGAYADEELNLLLARRGFFGRLFRGLFRLINHSWQMYPVGVLFGLGFDTATEVGLLGISAAQASKGLAVWSIMLFPALFTAGMSLIDTADSVLMLGTYGWAFAKPIRKLYYNMTITAVSVLVALIIGGLETLNLVRDRLNLSGVFWNAVAALNDHFGSLGFVIIGIFAISWVVSILFYKLSKYDDIDVTKLRHP
jgi:high-affinity nickel-transport protein